MLIEESTPLWQRRRLLDLSWSELGAGMDRLREQILSSGYEPTCVVGICRGGLVLAASLSNVLDLPNFHVLGIVRNLTNSRYSERGAPRFGWLSPGGTLKGERVLVADDIAGDGGTLALAVEVLLGHEPEEIRTAVIVRNQACRFVPDYFAFTVDDWVVFPWEAKPAANALSEPLRVARRSPLA